MTKTLHEPPQLRVLVAEDDNEQREQLALLMCGIGCRVDVAADGTEAVRQVRRLKPEVVLMDLGMPVMNGWDAIRWIRQDAPGKTPYIIAVSAFGKAHDRRAAFEAGCNEFIVKPLDVRGALRAYVYRKRYRALLEE